MKIYLNLETNQLELTPDTNKDRKELRDLSNQLSDANKQQASLSIMGRIARLEIPVNIPNK